MAELLIKAIDATHSDSVKDKRGCYKRGDIVVVMPDGHVWGREEGLPKFVKVKIPGLAVDTVLKHIEPEVDVNGDVVTRRKWGVLVDNVPLTILNTLKTTGEVTVTLAQIRNYIKDKVTGITA